MSGNSCGRRIIQYFDSSAGIVQPTRMVGMSCAPATVGAMTGPSSDAAAAAKSDILVMNVPAVVARRVQRCAMTVVQSCLKSAQPSPRVAGLFLPRSRVGGHVGPHSGIEPVGPDETDSRPTRVTCRTDWCRQ